MSREISYGELQKHNNEQSIWMVIHKDVYDVTSFLEEHPGGADSLLEYGGKDGTQPFEDVAHSDDARELLKKYKIGTLPEGEQIPYTKPNTKPQMGFVPYLQKFIVLPETGTMTTDADDVPTGPCGYCPLGLDADPRSPRPPGQPNTPTGRSNGPPEPWQRPAPPPPPDPGPGSYNESYDLPITSECIKWAVIALAGAVIIGLAIRSLKSKSK